MRLRLGVGGRALGVRGGISTRGFGVGVGPVSAGSSWRGRRRRRSGGGWAGLILILAAVGWLISLCDPQPSQPPQPPPPITATPTTTPFYVPPPSTTPYTPPPSITHTGPPSPQPTSANGPWYCGGAVACGGCVEGGTPAWDGYEVVCVPEVPSECPDWYAKHPNWDNEHGDMPCGVPHYQPPTYPTPTPTRWGLPPAEWHCLPTDPNPEQALPDPRFENWRGANERRQLVRRYQPPPHSPGRWHVACGDASVDGARDAELGAILGSIQQPSAIATAPLDEPEG
ncbi:hypothetical protein [Mycobacterium sp.]|uniref:hypothetical protein n=1 Tax=Mycobacterium sp. TaxID=1785 RepID=UPI003F9BF752